jgi:hypothetical protein
MSTESSPAPGLRQRLHDFFYSEEVPYGLALVRMVMPLVLLVPMAPRWLHTRELYSTDGANTPLWIAYGWPNMLPEPSGTAAVILHTALILFFLTMSAGWCTRISCIGATVLYTYLNLLDSVSTITKYSCIATHVLLLLCLSRCGAVWSVDALLKRRRDPLGAAAPQTDLAWPRRLMQLMIGLVYFGAAITKMHTPAFFSGDQMLFWMLAQLNWGHALGEYLALAPSLIIVSAYIAIVWEVTFLFLCWKGLGRPIMIALGIVFHLMTWLTLGLFVFPLVCFTIYLCFLNERDIRRIGALVQRVRSRAGWKVSWSARVSEAWRRLPVPAWSLERSLAAFAAVTVVVCTGGAAVEHLRDPYGLRRSEGAHALRELDAEQVRIMLQPTKPIQQQDKIFAFDVGRTLLGGVILDRSKQFRHGESLIAQVHMNPPYEDMWVECYLEDTQGHRMNLIGQSVVAREHPRTNFMHQLDSGLPPGDYSVVLLSAGREVARRDFRLLPAVESPVAN